MKTSKVRMLITCQNVILERCSECMRWLRERFEIIPAGCALSEKETLRVLDSANVMIIGGAEIITPKILHRWRDKAPGNKISLIFAGIQESTSYPPQSIDFMENNHIPHYRTGGGEEAVIRSTFEEITNKARKNKRILIIGAGGIGGGLLKKLKKAGYENLVYTASRQEKAGFRELGIEYEPDLKKAFHRVDVVSLHLPLTPETEGLIKLDHLNGIMLRGVFVNNARAKIVDPKGFLSFLGNRQDVSNIWDVFYEEGNQLIKSLKTGGNIRLKKLYGYFSEHTVNLFSENEDKIDWKKIFQDHPGNLFTSHSTAMRPPTFQEYGEGIKKLVIEHQLDKL